MFKQNTELEFNQEFTQQSHKYQEITSEIQLKDEENLPRDQIRSDMSVDRSSLDEQIGEIMKMKSIDSFLFERVIEIDKPELIKEGYLTSYKLYKIKSKTKNTNETTCVNRRFNDFQFLHDELIQKYGGYVLPRLPTKNIFAKFNFENKQFQQVRTRELQKYLQTLLHHSRIRYSNELKSFLFDQEIDFSFNKGKYIEKSTTFSYLKDITSSVYDISKQFYQKYVISKDKLVSFSKNVQEEQALRLFEREIQDLIKVTKIIEDIIHQSFQQLKMIHEFSLNSNKPHLRSLTNEQVYLETISALICQFEEISNFILCCHDAITRTKQLRAEIEDLEEELKTIQTKEKSHPRNRQLDIIRNKIITANSKCERWIGSLKKQLAIYTSEGKTLMEQFVKKFTKLKGQIYSDV